MRTSSSSPGRTCLDGTIYPKVSNPRSLDFQEINARLLRRIRFRGGPSNAIGLDIGSFSAKGVKVAPAPAGLRVLQTAISLIPPGADKPHSAEAIRQLFQKLDSREAAVAIAIGGTGTVLRPVSFPKMTPHELKTALSFEAEKHIPFKLAEVYLDSAIMRDQAGGRMEVFLAAARKELVEQRLELLSQAGVTPRIVDLEMLALANGWELDPMAEKGEAVGLVCVGHCRTLLDFIRGRSLEFAREIPIGGQVFTQAIAKALQLDESSAERIKCEPGNRAAEIRTVLQPVWEEWFHQCRASFDFYESQHGRRVERLVLSGGSARLAGFKDWIQEAAGLPTESWKPPAGLTDGIDLSVAVGLAARGVAP